MMKWTILALLGAIGVTCALPANAAGPLPATKLMALVRAEHCDRTRLEGTLAGLGRALARDRRTSRVAIDRPADPIRNLDLMGNTSPFAAALEISASQPALARIGERVRRRIAALCPVDVYLVHERRLMTTPRTWPLGTPSPDTKVLNTLIRNEGLSFERFDAEWSGPHAALALGWRRLRGGEGHYVQNPVVGSIGNASQAYDGIGEGEGSAGGAGSDAIRKIRLETAAHARTFHRPGPMFVVRETVLKD